MGGDENDMSMKRTSCVAIAVLLVCLGVVYASNRETVVEFFYIPVGCPDCEEAQSLITEIERQYSEKLCLEWIDVSQREGFQRFRQYNLRRAPAVVINCEYIISSDEMNHEKLVTVIGAYLQGAQPRPNPSMPLSLMTTFSLGFFDTFSPCLIAILSFILSYTIGKTTGFKEGMLRIMVFGMGFISAAVLLGATVALALVSTPTFQNMLVWIMCIFVIFFGLSLLGFIKIPIQTKPLVTKLAKNYASTHVGLFSLGFLFYFLDPCIAPFCFTILVMVQNSEFTLHLVVFCLGATIPFVGIGILAGSASKLARKTYKHRSKIRAISGLILIGYALYLIIFYLL